jgi:hypothetical protein
MVLYQFLVKISMQQTTYKQCTSSLENEERFHYTTTFPCLVTLLTRFLVVLEAPNYEIIFSQFFLLDLLPSWVLNYLQNEKTYYMFKCVLMENMFFYVFNSCIHMKLYTLKNFIFTLWHALWLCDEPKSLFLVKRLGLNPSLKKDGGVEFNLDRTWLRC